MSQELKRCWRTKRWSPNDNTKCLILYRFGTIWWPKFHMNYYFNAPIKPHRSIALKIFPHTSCILAWGFLIIF